MSQLHFALTGIGVVVILGVVIYNKWVERKAARRTRAAFGPGEEDALLRPTSPREEPALRAEPVFEGDLTPMPQAPRAEEMAFDDETELIVSLSFDHPIAGEQLATAASGLHTIGSKPVLVCATNTQTNRLEAPRAGETFSGLHCGVLLANRQGPLNAVEFSEFIGAVQRIAGPLDVEVDVPDMTDALAHAKRIDERCAGVDAQIGVNLTSNGGSWSGTQIAQAAVEAGFAQRGDGRFAYYRRNGAELFTLQAIDAQGKPVGIGANAEAVNASVLTFVLDVPRAPEVEKPFSTMINIARALAARLGGSVVDDNRRPVTDAALANIETQLKPMYARIRDAGFEPGSPRALLLFNQG